MVRIVLKNKADQGIIKNLDKALKDFYRMNLKINISTRTNFQNKVIEFPQSGVSKEVLLKVISAKVGFKHIDKIEYLEDEEVAVAA